MLANATNKSANTESDLRNPYQAPRGGNNDRDCQQSSHWKERRFVARIRNNAGMYLLLGLALSDVLLAAAYESPRVHAVWQRAAELLTASFFVSLVVFWFYRITAFRRFECAALAALFTIYAVVVGRFRPEGTTITAGMVPCVVFGSFQLLGVAMAATSLVRFVASYRK